MIKARAGEQSKRNVTRFLASNDAENVNAELNGIYILANHILAMMECVQDTCTENGIYLHEFKRQYELMLQATKHLVVLMDMRRNKSHELAKDWLRIYDIVTKVIDIVIGDPAKDGMTQEAKDEEADRNLCDIFSDKLLICQGNKEKTEEVLRQVMDMGCDDGSVEVTNRVNGAMKGIVDRAIEEKNTTAKRRTCMEWVDWTLDRVKESMNNK